MYEGHMDKPKWVGSRVGGEDGWVGGSGGRKMGTTVPEKISMNKKIIKII